MTIQSHVHLIQKKHFSHEYFRILTSSPNASSLLFDSRQIHTEASALAFSTITFVSKIWFYYKLAHRASILPGPLYFSMTSFAFTPHPVKILEYGENNIHVLATFLTSTVYVFSRLEQVTLFGKSGNRVVYIRIPFYKSVIGRKSLVDVINAFVGGRVMVEGLGS